MKCRVCEKNKDYEELLDGVFEDKIDKICKDCLKKENVPIIKKPKKEEKENLSISQRIEKLSTKQENKRKEILSISLAKLRIPPKKEESLDLVDNYYWIIQNSRRKRKMTQTQLSEKLIIPLQVIVSLEKGQIPNNFYEYIDKLENFFEIKLWKENAKEKYFPEDKNKKQEIILENLKEKVKENFLKRFLNNFKKKKQNQEKKDISSQENRNSEIETIE